MTTAEAPEVDWVLTAAVEDYPGGTNRKDIPLERIDGNNVNNVDAPDGWVHTVKQRPQEMNYLVATLTNRPDIPMGTEYDLRGDATVQCRVIGVHISEMGAINPGVGDETNVAYPTVGWDTLTDNLRRALYTDREYPSVGRTNTGYKDMFIENWDDQSGNFGDYYLLTFTVVFSGFEDLPD